jgi:tetratricopeptide (TPR) repeat protein/nucleoside-triphosphatase THEP1
MSARDQETKDFFISYNRADRDWASWIAWCLEEAGYTTYFQDWDFSPGSNFIVEMEKAASTCRRTIAVLSQNYLNSVFTLPEWTAAFAKDPTGRDRTLLPILVGQCELPPFFSVIVYIDLIGLSESEATEKLLLKVKQVRLKPSRKAPYPGSTKTTSPAPPPFPGQTSPQSTVNPSHPAFHEIEPPPPDFKGRKEECSSYLTAIRENKYTMIGIFGSPGIGKTTLAQKLASELVNDYPDGQFYVNLKRFGDTSLSASSVLTYLIEKLSQKTKLPEHEEELSKLYRSILYIKRVLIFLDNAIDPKQFSLLKPPGGSLLIVASRQNFHLPGMYSLSLDELEPEASGDLLLSITPRIGHYAKTIAELCGHWPIALRNAAATLSTRQDIKVVEYISQLRTNKQRFVGQITPIMETSYELLKPEERKQQWCALSLFCGSFSKAAAASLWDLPADSTDNVIGFLLGHSMIKYNSVSERYYLHDWVRPFASARLTDLDLYSRRHAAFFFRYMREHRHPLILLDSEAENIFSAHRWCEKQLSTKRRNAFTRFIAGLLQTDENGAAQVVYLLARLYKRNDKLDMASNYYKECRQVSQMIGDVALQGACLRSLGELSLLSGNPRAGIKLIHRALEKLRGSHDTQSKKELIFSLILLADHYISQGQTNLASELAQESIQVRNTIPLEKMRPIEGLSNGARLLIRIYRDQGATMKAHKLLKRERRNFYGVELASALGEIGSIMIGTRKYAEAEKLLADAHKVYESIRNFGGCTWVMRSMGELYEARRDHIKAMECYKAALDICRDFKLEPYQISIALVELARYCFARAKEEKNAACYHEEGTRYWHEYLAVHKTFIFDSDSASKIKMAESLARFGRRLIHLGLHELAFDVLDETASLYRDARNLGGDAYVNQLIGDCWLAVGDRYKAKQVYQEAIGLRKQAREPLKVATCLHEIGTSYYAIGDIRTAQSYWENSLKVFKKARDINGEHYVRGLLLKYCNIRYSSRNQLDKSRHR